MQSGRTVFCFIEMTYIQFKASEAGEGRNFKLVTCHTFVSSLSHFTQLPIALISINMSTDKDCRSNKYP